MFCLFVFGHRYMGACEYFTYNGGEFYVNARMYHIQFCPVSVDQAVLKFPSVPDRGRIITQVNGILWRCFMWAALRSYSLVASLFLLILGLLFLNTRTAIVLFVFAGLLLMLSIGTWIYKPKASKERVDAYLQLLNPTGSTPLSEPTPLKQTPHSKGALSHVMSMVRPSAYQTLQDEPSPHAPK